MLRYTYIACLVADVDSSHQSHLQSIMLSVHALVCYSTSDIPTVCAYLTLNRDHVVAFKGTDLSLSSGTLHFDTMLTA